jgi:hypothetical protein
MCLGKEKVNIIWLKQNQMALSEINSPFLVVFIRIDGTQLLNAQSKTFAFYSNHRTKWNIGMSKEDLHVAFDEWEGKVWSF